MALVGRLPICLPLIALALAACGQGARELKATHAAIGAQVAARVGDVDVSASLVGAVAATRRVSPAEALGLLVDDVVTAQGARAQGLDRDADVEFAITAALARATVERVKAAAFAAPPSDDEVRAISASHWTLVDAPETMVVIHAVALRPKEPDASAESAARVVASAIAAAEVDAVDADDFKARAEAVPHGGVTVQVEQLQPFTADGRVAVADNAGAYDPRFAAGAATLRKPGTTSGVVESPFGWHVIRLLERRPPVQVAFEDRRRMFAEEVYGERSYKALDALETARRTTETVRLANGVDDLLAEAVLPRTDRRDSTPATPRSP